MEYLEKEVLRLLDYLCICLMLIMSFFQCISCIYSVKQLRLRSVGYGSFWWMLPNVPRYSGEKPNQPQYPHSSDSQPWGGSDMYSKGVLWKVHQTAGGDGWGNQAAAYWNVKVEEEHQRWSLGGRTLGVSMTVLMLWFKFPCFLIFPKV